MMVIGNTDNLSANTVPGLRSTQHCIVRDVYAVGGAVVTGSHDHLDSVTLPAADNTPYFTPRLKIPSFVLYSSLPSQ